MRPRSTPSLPTLAFLVLAAVAVAGCLGGGGGDVVGDDVRLDLLHAPFDAPVAAVDPADGSDAVYVLQQAGRIEVWTPDDGLRPTPFLDLEARVSASFEQGLLGLAFPPDWPDERRAYVSYTNAQGDTRLVRYNVTAGPDPAVLEDEREVLLRLPQPTPVHNGGHIVFGPDGVLWMGLGDGGRADDPRATGQDPGDLYGSILRLDVDTPWGAGYEVPPTNPFANATSRDGGDGLEGRPEVWAFGLRNPWRFHHDPATGDLWIGDVGQDHREEVDHVPTAPPPGEAYNFGWSVLQGTLAYPNGSNQELASPHTPPVHEYPHGPGCSVTGGVVLHDPALPSHLQGRYVFADYCDGVLRTLDPHDGYAEDALLETDLAVASFGVLEDGSVLVVDRGGALYELRPAG